MRWWGKGGPVNVLVATLLVATAGLFPASCPGLILPVDGEVVREFAPVGSYAGHWGIDVVAPEGSAVRPADAGTVTFAGAVAEMLSVTVDHGGGLRTSYSYLTSIAVKTGDLVGRDTVLGESGLDHGVAAVHFSVRVDAEYQDPRRWLRCFDAPHKGLRLIPVPEAYASRRATRHSWRYV